MAKNGGAGGRINREDSWVKQGTAHARPLQEEQAKDKGNKQKVEEDSVHKATKPDGPPPRD